MNIPEQEDALRNVIHQTNAAYASTYEASGDEAAADFSARLALIDPETIGEYACAYLNDENHGHGHVPNLRDITLFDADPETKEDIRSWMNNNPAAVGAYSAIHDILLNYFEDLEALSADEPDGAAFQATSVFIKEVGWGVLWEEMLPETIRDFTDEQKDQMDGKDLSDGLARAFASGIFETDTAMCPFKQRVYHVFALKPERDQETGEVTINGRAAGALPAFIHNEIKNGIQAPQPEGQSLD